MADNFSLEILEEPRLATPQIKRTTLILLVTTLVGLTAGVYASMLGHGYAYNIFREMPWGLLVSTFAFFAVAATGLCIVAVLSVFPGLKPLAPLRKRAVYMSIVVVTSGFMVISFAFASPWRMLVYNMTSPNLTSNLWWMGTLYGIMVGCMFLQFVAVLTGHPGSASKTGIVGAVAGVGANNNLGAAFTNMADPPMWYGAQLPIFFLASAVLSGAALMIICTNFAFRMREERMSDDILKAMKSAGTIMALMLSLLLVVMASRYISLFVGSNPEPGRVAALALLKGPLAFNFWGLEVLVGLVAPLLLVLVTRAQSLSVMSLAGALALAGCFFQRYDLVVSGQMVPKFAGWNGLPTYFSYTPSVAELLVVLGALCLAGAGFLLGERFLGRIFRYRPPSQIEL